jgi:hypothetical protein
MKQLHVRCRPFWGMLLLVLIFAISLLAAAPALAQQLASTPPTPAPQAVPPGVPTPDQAKEQEAFNLGVEAYIYGYPLVTMEMTRRVITNVAAPQGKNVPMGQFGCLREYPDASFREVTTPNADTLYSIAWLDLSREPYVLSLPNEHGRYYLMPMLDGWTNIFQSPGTRTTGTKAQKYLISGPGWKGPVPQGLKELKSPTNLVWILGRTHCRGTKADYQAVHKIQDQYHVVPLSYYGKPYTPPPGKVNPAIDMKTPVREQVHRMEAAAFFKLLAALLKDNPPAPGDAPMMAKLAKIGIVPGKEFDPRKLDPAMAKGLARVPQAAVKKIMANAETVGKMVHGWGISLKTGQYGTDYLLRASIAAIGLGANLPQDAVYPFSRTDQQGKPYDGAHQYVLHFPKGQLPPVKAFWSLTMYNPQLFFVANPLNRYNLSSRNKFKYNKDGSLDLYIQNESPGKSKEANWLPAPKGKFVLVLRLYWPAEPPQPSILNGSWKPPAVTRVD